MILNITILWFRWCHMSYTSISQYRDEVIQLYEQTLSYRETARILCDRYPDIPNANWTRELVARELDYVSRYEETNEEEYPLTELIDPPSRIFITKRCCFFPVNTGTFMIFNPCLINPTVSVGKGIKSRLWIGLYYLRPVSNRSLMIS